MAQDSWPNLQNKLYWNCFSNEGITLSQDGVYGFDLQAIFASQGV